MNVSRFSVAVVFLAAIGLCRPVLANPREGLILWLDAERPGGGEVAPGAAAKVSTPEGALSRWVDLSGNGNDLAQDEIGRSPILVSDGLNGRPTVRFRGTDLLKRAAVKGLAEGDQSFHIVIVFQAPEGGPSAQRLLDLNSSPTVAAAFETRHGFWVGFQAQRYIPRLGIHSGDEGEAKTPIWDSKPHVLELVYAGEHRFEIHVDGRRERRSMFRGTHFLGFQKHVTLALGQHYGSEENANTWFNGDLSEVMIYSRALSTSERIAIASRLKQKYELKTEFETLPVFEKDIRPLLAKHCFECHGEEVQERGLDLRTVSAMLQGGEAGPVIVRGDPDQSEMMAILDSGKMPPDPTTSLSDDELALIRRWIEADSPSEEIARPHRPPPKFAASDREHWAWQRLRPHKIPDVVHRELVENRIDRHLLVQLEQKRLSYSAEAADDQLVRRVYFDLLGIPPTPDELDDYAGDQRPLKFERLVDRLLASSHFGERWGRHWLDVAGFVDVVGSDNDAAIIKPLAGKWRYRDYVIRSFNQDRPFDQFLVEQLAGDELHDWRDRENFTPEIVDALIATGFLLSANDDTDQNELNTPDVRHHVLQRTSENVANALFAVTLQCAKCHDHKYESLSQIDYYRFEAVFAPIFNVRNWVVSNARTRADVSNRLRDEIDRVNVESASQMTALDQRRAAIRAASRERIFAQKLLAIPEPDRDAVRQAVTAAADKRTDAQKQLVAKHGDQVAVSDAEIDAALSPNEREEIGKIDQGRATAMGLRREYEQISIASESSPPARTHVLRRGDWMRPGLEVQAELFEIFTDDGSPYSLRAVSSSDTSGRRLALANAATDANSVSGQHVARVYVNRVWQQLFGRGIVETSDNFGVSGSPPSHPELLDWLAREFIQNDWRPKRLIRQMVLSRAYRQSTVATEEHPAMSADPDNRLLWRMNLRRLDSEQLRDAILSASGSLDATVGGPPIPLSPLPNVMVVVKTDGLPAGTSPFRRSVYLLARRNYHLTLMRVFDQPIVARTCAVRKPSAMVTQSLALLHDEFLFDQSARMADGILQQLPNATRLEHIDLAWRLVLGRLPNADEAELCVGTWARHVDRFAGSENPDRQAFAQICQMLLNTNEFLYLE